MAVLLLAGATFGLLLLEKRQAFGGVATFLVGVAGTTAAAQAGVIPYAPLLAEAPFANGRLAGSWLVGAGAVNFVGLLAVLAVIYLLIDRRHDREDSLARTSDPLARANDIISRYVASQLAEQIRAGSYEAVENHDRRRLTLVFAD